MGHLARSGKIVDLISKRIFPGTIYIHNGKITAIDEVERAEEDQFILPGFIDAHVHIESSMLIPSEFARLASIHGTVGTVSDPHEIANVLGLEGIRYMIHNGQQVPFHFYFGASSCVPATNFETAGAVVSAEDIEVLFRQDGLHYLSEMMNYPGVINQDSLVMEKLNIAKKWKRPIDGHAPGLTGVLAEKYEAAGITTDHECYTLEEALGKAKLGMHILIREGSAAKNFSALHPLLKIHPELVMFCSDDKHPDALVKGHINALVIKSIELGYDLMDVLRAACLNPISHYNMQVGLLQEGDSADFIIVNNLKEFQVKENFVRGECIASQGKTKICSVKASTPNHFEATTKEVKDFILEAPKDIVPIQVIQAQDGQLITEKIQVMPTIKDGCYASDPERDLLKIVVVNRYVEKRPSIGFIKNFGLKRGAIASCVAHDSHNIIAVGCEDEALCQVVNLLIDQKGGIGLVDNQKRFGLELPVGGIMSASDGFETAKKYAELDKWAKSLGSTLQAPFMTLSFMALLVIPSLKLSDLGLFDGDRFKLIPLEVT